jgi:hypothetical protein
MFSENKTAKLLLAIHSVTLIILTTLFCAFEIWHFYTLLFGR